MQTIHATEAAEAATNINRADWIHGAAELVLANEVQYDRSGERYQEAFISRESVVEDISCTDEYELLIIKWLDGGECCDGSVSQCLHKLFGPGNNVCKYS